VKIEVTDLVRDNDGFVFYRLSLSDVDNECGPIEKAQHAGAGTRAWLETSDFEIVDGKGRRQQGRRTPVAGSRTKYSGMKVARG
jgi:hypothetical protein